MAIDYENYKRYKRNAFFYAASLDYYGAWMGPSDCVWIVPRYNNWECD